jgi:sporulation protein YlmC with PRC-barrel domain
MDEIKSEAGTKLGRVYDLTLNMVKKFTTALEKEWAATAPKSKE